MKEVNIINQLRKALNDLQSIVIGYAILPFGTEMIIEIGNTSDRTNEYSEVFVRTISLGGSGGFEQQGMVINPDRIKLFPDNKTLLQMIGQPFMFDAWCTKNRVGKV